jgi:hypothetical protein
VNGPKAKRAPAKSAFQNAQLLRAYCFLNIVQAPFAFAFWMIEQRKARLLDRIECERSDQ